MNKENAFNVNDTFEDYLRKELDKNLKIINIWNSDIEKDGVSNE